MSWLSWLSTWESVDVARIRNLFAPVAHAALFLARACDSQDVLGQSGCSLQGREDRTLKEDVLRSALVPPGWHVLALALHLARASRCPSQGRTTYSADARWFSPRITGSLEICLRIGSLLGVSFQLDLCTSAQNQSSVVRLWMKSSIRYLQPASLQEHDRVHFHGRHSAQARRVGEACRKGPGDGILNEC